MPPKTKSFWKRCDQCRIILWERDTQSHKEQCDTFKVETNKYYALSHGFIKDCNLYAVVKFKKDGGSNLSKIFSRDMAFLHPSTMKMCKICCIDKIIITSSSGYQTLHTVWPDSTISPTTVVLSKDGLIQSSNGKLVHVKTYHNYPEKATCVSLSLENPNKMELMTKTELKTVLLNQNCGHFVTYGTRIICRFYGNLCELTVRHIEGEKHFEVETSEGSFDDYVSETQRLSLEDSIDDSMFKCSTPVRSKSDPSVTFCSIPSVLPELQNISDNEIQFFSISPQTKFQILYENSGKDKTDYKITFNSVGGLRHQIQTLKEILHLLKLSFHHPGFMPKGILFHGPAGTGKTMIAHAVANEWNGTFISVDGPKIYSNCYGESEAKLKEIFEEASEKAPAIIFIDEIDSLCPKRQGTVGVEGRIISTLHTLIDGLCDERKILTIGATNRPEAVDPGLLRSGRLEKQIEFGFPTANERFEILQKLLQSYRHSLSEEDIRDIADNLHGYTGSDLAALCTNAWSKVAEGCPESLKEEPMISLRHFTYSMKNMKPFVLRGICVEIPKVNWMDIGGMHSTKVKLQQLIDWPRTHHEVFQRMGISQRRGLLMYGPPGCSKTMIAKAVATESGLNFIAVKGPELFNKWVGESEKSVRELFCHARSVAPCIIFFDEIDALAAERGSTEGGTNVADRVLAQLLTEMDGLNELNDVFIIAATNRPDRIDKALQRPGRLDSIIYIPLPDYDTRKEILTIQFGKMPVAQDVQLEKLVEMTEGYSGAELVGVCHQAALNAMTECITCEHTAWKHFFLALEEVRPRTSREMIKFYEDFAKKGKAI